MPKPTHQPDGTMILSVKKPKQNNDGFNNWRELAAHLHQRLKAGKCTLVGVDSVMGAYSLAVSKGFKGHQGEWMRTVKNAGAEFAGSKVPAKILGKR